MVIKLIALICLSVLTVLGWFVLAEKEMDTEAAQINQKEISAINSVKGEGCRPEFVC